MILVKYVYFTDYLTAAKQEVGNIPQEKGLPRETAPFLQKVFSISRLSNIGRIGHP
jgi:hypothetical protein